MKDNILKNFEYIYSSNGIVIHLRYICIYSLILLT